MSRCMRSCGGAGAWRARCGDRPRGRPPGGRHTYTGQSLTDQPLRSRLSPLTIGLALAGIVLFVIAIRQVGWAAVVSGIGSVGFSFAAVVALGAARMACRAAAWRVSVAPAELPFGRAFSATLAADALGNLTPLGLLASEPTKIVLSRTHLPTVVSVSSVAIENAFYTASVLAMLLSGAWLFLQRADVPPILEETLQAVVVAAAVAALVAAWMARTRPAVLSRLAGWVRRLRGRPASPAETLQELEERFYSVMDWPPSRVLRVFAWEGLFHALAVAEVWLIVRLLPGGASATLADAFLLETAGRFITVAFKFVPYRLGVDELGSGTVSQALGFGPTLGVTLALVRRLRILCLNAIGLALLAGRGRA